MTTETTAAPAAGQYELSHLRSLEAEAIHIIREVAAEFERPVLLFSGGKDSIVMLHLAVKAFWPGRLPFPVMHVDTGHNFDEVIEFRDQLVAETGVRLVVASVQDDIDAGRVVEDTGPSRNPLQTVDPAARHPGEPLRRRIRRRPARRGEGPRQGAGLQLPRRVRPVGPQGPAAGAVEPLQRPAPQRRAHPGLPAVELDRVRHLDLHRRRADQAAVDLLRAPPPGVQRDGMLLAVHRYLQPSTDEQVFETSVRFRTVGDVDLHRLRRVRRPRTVDEVIAETAVSRLTERGATRADDRISEAGMEDRKRQGYF